VKYIVIIGDGMADFPLEELDGRTPLMAARKPYMDMMAREGFCGKVVTVPEGMPPGSDVAGMSLFGYDPAKYYTGRAPIEAFAMGIVMDENDVAFRCNLVNLELTPAGTIMGDYSGGHITTPEAKILIEDINGRLGSKAFEFYPGISYRHIMLWKDGLREMKTTPPHDITKKDISRYMPAGDGSEMLINLMDGSRQILKEHPLNKKRIEEGKLPANSIWLWGQGIRSQLPSFFEKYQLKGATVAAVDLVKGISGMIGFDTPVVEGATGYIDTNFKGKAQKALELLEDHDIVYIHVEAPDEASHNGNTGEKIQAIERIDGEIVRTLYESIREPAKFLIVTDHATPVSMKTHYGCPVPFAIFTKGKTEDGFTSGYDENVGEKEFTGEELIDFFIRGQKP
jgi:2,3-bisphosphoglycerate-independent phosphoglycerate mutase